MTEQPGRRERKKAATRKTIADTAMRMFQERGYDAVGIREIAAAADVAITTLFAHFPSKEALFFDEDQKREEWLTRAVTDREPGQSIPDALRQRLHATVGEFARPGAASFWRMVDGSPALSAYASTMWLRHEDALASAIAADLGLAEPSTVCRAYARFVLDVYPLARRAADPAAAVDEIFDLLNPGWARLAAGARVFAYVREIGAPDSIECDADTPVVLASVVKIIVAVAFARAIVAGSLDATEVVSVPARYRVGGVGTAGCADPVSMSLRDLALFMLSMSDNAATDVLYQRVGQPAIDAVVTDLGLSNTYVRGDIESIFLSVVAELGLPDATDLDAEFARADPAAVWKLSCIDPARSNASTARDIGTLLEAIWTDRAAAPEACAMVRSWMSQTFTTHGLAAAFPDGVRVASKTGTLPAIRNEAGVLTYPDGRQYVAAVFTRADSLTERQPAVDAAIGAAARTAVDHLRRKPQRDHA